MAIKDLYLELSNQPYSKEVLNAFLDLRKDAMLAGNNEYFYLCGIKIADIYLESNVYTNAIEVLSKDLEKIDPITFKNIYVANLERIIYAYIKKGNFKLAFKFVSEKRKYIDDKDHDKVNRWYIEMAYVYGEMGQTTKALSCLNAIVENLPDDDTLSYALSNITKIYIDQNMLDEAKKSLQSCLRVTNDDEGMKYCNYLLAKIMLLEGNFIQASELFDGLFELEAIEEDYLGIANEYIDELLKHKELTKAKELLKKASRFVASSNDERVKKYYLLNKVKYIATSLELNNIVDIVNEIDKLDKSINSSDSSNLVEALEDEKDYEVNANLTAFVTLLEKVNALNTFEFTELSLRDNIYAYMQKLEEVVRFEQITICLFNKNNRLPFIPQNEEFTTFDYHKQRLYERNVSYNAMSGSVLDKVISSNNALAFDLNNVKMPINDFNTGKSLQDLQINSCLAIPFTKNGEINDCVVFYAKFLDLTAPENEILLKVAASFIINKINLWQQIENERFDLTINNYLDTNTLCMYHYEDKLFVNRQVASLLGIKAINRFTEVEVTEYANSIKNAFNINYLDLFKVNSDSTEKNINLSYGFKTKTKVVDITEDANLVVFDNKKLYFSCLNMASKDQTIQTKDVFASDQMLFNTYLESLKPKTKDIEFKFSMLRIASAFAKDKVKSRIHDVIGVNSYYLDDETYAVIIENEVNQRTIDAYIKELGYEVGVVRFPRDLVDLDDIVKFSKICLDSKAGYFSDEVYQTYLRKQTVSKIIDNVIDTNLDFAYLELGTYANANSYEVRLNIPGVSLDQNIRDLIDANALHKYELKLLETFKPLKNTQMYYLNVSFDSLEDYINNSDNVRIYQNVIYVVDGYKDKHLTLLKTFNQQHINCIVEYKVLDKLPTNAFIHSYISGIAIFEGLDQEFRHSLIDFVTKINFPVYANYQFLDYAKCIYRKDSIVTEKEVNSAE